MVVEFFDRLSRIIEEPFLRVAFLGALFLMFISTLDENLIKKIFEYLSNDPSIVRVVAGLLMVALTGLIVARYLGLTIKKSEDYFEKPYGHFNNLSMNNYRDSEFLAQEIARYVLPALEKASSNKGYGDSPQVKIDDDFKSQIISQISADSKSAIASFIESEVFRRVDEARYQSNTKDFLSSNIDGIVMNYQGEMNSWRKNANVNLVIGLTCAVLGIFVMWQTLILLNFDEKAEFIWKSSDIYRVIARFGLVLVIESVAFFFLKIYREDRSMIKYLRNEITNIESKFISLKVAFLLGTADDITKSVVELSRTERNFVLKKDEKIISDIQYENNEILIEKMLDKIPEILEKINNRKSENHPGSLGR